MKTKELVALKLREIDVIKEQISELQKKEQGIRFEISSLKKDIEAKNSHLIGKKAKCSMRDVPSFQDVVCTCSRIMVTEDFNVKPFFLSPRNERVNVDYYEWL